MKNVNLIKSFFKFRFFPQSVVYNINSNKIYRLGRFNVSYNVIVNRRVKNHHVTYMRLNEARPESYNILIILFLC